MVNGNSKENNVKEEDVLEDQLSKIAGNDAFNAFVEVFDKVPTEGKQKLGRNLKLLFNSFTSINLDTSNFLIIITPIHYRRKRERSSEAVDVRGYGSNFIWSTKTRKVE